VGVVVVEVEMRQIEPYIANQEVGIEWHWVEWGCYCGVRNLSDFCNRGYKCLTVGYFMGVDYSFTLR